MEKLDAFEENKIDDKLPNCTTFVAFDKYECKYECALQIRRTSNTNWPKMTEPKNTETRVQCCGQKVS